MDESKKCWYSKRRWTTILGIAINCFTTFEYASIAISALYYFEDSFHASSPRFYYGASMAAIFLSGVFSVFWCGRYMDKTRKLRKLFLILMGFGTVGNILYTFSFSVWLPILGRFISGCKAGAESAFAGMDNNKRKLIIQLVFSCFFIFNIQGRRKQIINFKIPAKLLPTI